MARDSVACRLALSWRPAASLCGSTDWRGRPGGWCAKGRGFPQRLDLSGREAIAFWLRGDGQRETLRFQFRDAQGTPADWLVPIDFTGWRLQVLCTADRPDFDWHQTEYLILYFGDIPSSTTVALGFDDVRAFSKLQPPPALVRPELLVNDQRLCLPADLAPGQGLTIDDLGHASLWPLGPDKPKPIRSKCGPIILQPGENRVTLSCKTAQGAPRGTTVRLASTGPVSEGERRHP